jgi:hypothetical protein
MQELRLVCLGGSPAPAGLQDDLRAIAALPEDVLRDFWEILEPSLADVLDDRVGAAAAKFCRDREVTREALAPIVKACRTLFRSGAALGVPAERLGGDLTRLGIPDAIVGGCLLPCYERALASLRQGIIAQAVSAHGHLVTGFDWRVDAIRATRRGRGLDQPVTMITFAFRDGDATRTITLQMLPETLAELHREIGAMLG